MQADQTVVLGASGAQVLALVATSRQWQRRHRCGKLLLSLVCRGRQDELAWGASTIGKLTCRIHRLECRLNPAKDGSTVRQLGTRSVGLKSKGDAPSSSSWARPAPGRQADQK